MECELAVSTKLDVVNGGGSEKEKPRKEFIAVREKVSL